MDQCRFRPISPHTNVAWCQCHFIPLPLCTNTGVNLMKKIWCKFTCSFCKLDLFIVMQQILLIFIKWSGLQKRVCKFTPKSFMRLTPYQCHFTLIADLYIYDLNEIVFPKYYKPFRGKVLKLVLSIYVKLPFCLMLFCQWNRAY